jgi:hypothetical protein
MSERGEGEPPSGRGRRRLTLAPRPWAAAERGKTNAKVSATVFADTAAEAMDGEVSSQARVKHARSSVGSTSGISSSFLEAGNGSRFWALAVDESSDDELSPFMERFPSRVAQAPPACSTPTVQCKLSQGLGARKEGQEDSVIWEGR